MRVYILAQMFDRPENGLSAYRTLAARYPVAHGGGNHSPLLLLGRKAEAVASARRDRQAMEKVMQPPPWIQRQGDYNCELISAEQLLAETHTRWARGLAHYYIGFTKLAEGDRAGAREHLSKMVAIHIFPSPMDYVSRMTLARMEKDPTWPPWIPVKK
jgi:hypothetical protein